MKNTKICPKCESREVYTKTKVASQNKLKSISIAFFTSVYIDMYICANCGYFEEYIAEQDLRNKKKMDKIKQKWKRL